MTEEEILQGGTIIAHKVAEDNVCICIYLKLKKINYFSLFIDGCPT